MASMPDIPCQSSVESRVALNFPQSITAWHSQTTPSQSLCAGTCQYNWQAATPLQQSFPRNVGTSSITTQPSLSVSVMLDSMMPIEDAYLIDTPSAREETGSKETPIGTEACPFPKCRKKCRRPQELERHVREHHLPYEIYCQQLGCNWTGNRRYALHNHLVHKHSGVPMPELEAITIYDAKGLVKQLLSKRIDVEQAVSKARLLFQKRAMQLGKLWIRGLKLTSVERSV